MKILNIPSWYKDNDDELNGIFFYEYAKEYKAKYPEDDVYFIYIECRSILKIMSFRNLFKLEKGESDGVKYKIIRTYNPFIKLNLLKGIYQFILLYLLTIREKFDLIHLHSAVELGRAVDIYSKIKRIPIIVTEHSSLLLGEDRLKKTGNIYNNCKRLITVSTALAIKLKEYTNRRDTLTIPNAIKLNNFYEKRKNDEFIYIGRLEKLKNVDIIIKIFSEYCESNKTTTLKIIGHGSQRSNLEKLVEDFGIKKRVKFLGFCNKEKIQMELSTSNLMLHMSNYETFGIVYIEAIASGCRVLTTVTDGAIDIFGDKYKHFIELSNLQIIDVIERVHECLEDKLPNIDLKKYSYSNILSEYRKQYFHAANMPKTEKAYC